MIFEQLVATASNWPQSVSRTSGGSGKLRHSDHSILRPFLTESTPKMGVHNQLSCSVDTGCKASYCLG
jgi:hypothetical protein